MPETQPNAVSDPTSDEDHAGIVQRWRRATRSADDTSDAREYATIHIVTGRLGLTDVDAQDQSAPTRVLFNAGGILAKAESEIREVSWRVPLVRPAFKARVERFFRAVQAADAQTPSASTHF